MNTDAIARAIGADRMDALLARLRGLNQDIAAQGIGIKYAYIEMLTGYSYGEYYDWDLYFENLYLSYYGEHRYCRNNAEAFLDQQLPCGFVARTLVNPRQRQHFKPFLAQTILLGGLQSGDWRWLSGKYYGRLKRYLDYWFYYCDLDRNGLCVWESADHSGMDNQVLRAGEIGAMEVEGVDLNCYLYRELLAMEKIAAALDMPADARAYQEHARKLAAQINAALWDERLGFYCDRNERTGERVPYRTISGFMPLWAGIAPPERAERIIREHLLDEKSFWLEYPVATWAKNEEGYYQQRKAGECNWMGPCWIPLNYMIFRGLLTYGYREEAKALADRTLDLVMGETAIREYYDAETGVGQGLNPFWGWSSLGLTMALEYELGYDPSSLEGPVRPILTEAFSLTFPAR